MAELGRLLLIIGLVIAFVGGLILLAVRYLPWVGNLPGDFSVESENFRLYFPLATMILVSIVGTLLLNIVLRLFSR